METEQTLFEFILSNKKLVQEYIEVRINIFKLELLRTNAKISGIILWMVSSIILFFFILIFAGITTGFYLSQVFHSYTVGFGITTGLITFLALLLTIFRKAIFINPIIRIILKQYANETDK